MVGDDTQATRAFHFLYLVSREHALTCVLVLQNRGQGLGFKVPGLGVVDKKALGTLAAKLYVVLGTVITAMFAMAEEEEEISSGVCKLSTVQANTIQGVMLGSNASCYNLTLGSIMN